MFKKKLLLASLLIGAVLLLAGFSCANSSVKTQAKSEIIENPAVQITFDFNRLSGFSSNQYAIWVEDLHGRYLQTIYATKFTANGGWKRRATSLPIWVKQSNLSEKSSSEIDVITSATPRAGNLSYYWDGADGDYEIVIEATLRGENQVYYRAALSIGKGASEAQVSDEYVGDAGDDRAMIGNVSVRALR